MENGDGGVAESQANLSDIQSYLVNFNKEISSATGQSFILAPPDGHVAVSQAGMALPGTADPMYAVTSLLDGGGEPVETKMKIEGEQSQSAAVAHTDGAASGYYTLQAGVVQSPPQSQAPRMVAVQDGPESQLLAVQADGTILNSEAQSQLGLPSTSADDSHTGIVTSQADQTGSEGESNAYQTVTIVPSEVNQSGEVSYVLIVSQPEGEEDEKGDMDMSVYDFKEEHRGGMSDSDEDGTPRKTHRSTPKKVITPMQQQLMCNYCNYTSPKRYLLTRHMKTHSEERPHKCHICDRGFKTVASLQNHINTHTGVRPHKCKECDAAFTTSGELVRHVRYRHTYEKPHKCTECDYASVELSKLKRHMRSHTGERPYQCPHCSYASPDTYKLKRHLRIHTGEKPYECDICHARFTQSNSLKAHKLIHTGNKPIYQCELCPTTCGRKTDLKIHVQKLHTSDKPLQCKKCGKSFPDRYTYKIHLKTHEGEKCFRCEICPYAALSQRHLESHILTHTGEKPYFCDLCDQTFRQKQLLKRHKNLYHTPDYVPPAPKDKCHECTVCSKVFAHKGNLLRHMVSHDPDNPEYQNALAEGDFDDEEEEEEEYDEDDDLDDDDAGALMQAVSNGQLVATSIGADGVHSDGGNVQIANINGQQVQVQLVSMGDENNPQVFIQLADGSQLQAVVANQDDSTEDLGELELEQQDDLSADLQALEDEEAEEEEEEEEEDEQEEEQEEEPQVVAATAPVIPRRGRGRPPKIKQEEIEDDDIAVSPRRSRRSSAQSPPASTGRVTRTRVKAEPEDDTESSKRSGDVINTPSKRPRRDSARRSNAEAGEEVKREEQKRKDIETCFGFDMGEDEG